MFNSYTYKDVLTRASTTIQIIDDTTLYKATIFSSNGNIFNVNETSSQLTLSIKKGVEDITNQFTDIVWSRFSENAGQYEEDLVWGEQHKGKKTFTLHRDDILEKANIQVAVYTQIGNERTLVAADYVSFIDINDMKGSETPPDAPIHGDIWVDTSITPPKLMVWNDDLKQWDAMTTDNDKRNLIRNSNFYKNTFDYWTTIGSPSLEIKAFNNKKWVRLLSNNNTSNYNGMSQTVSASKKSNYSFQMISSVYSSSTYPSGNAKVTINSVNNGIKTLLIDEVFDITTEVKNYNFSFTTLNDTEKIEVIISNEENTNCDFIFTNVKLEKYPFATEWELAIEDIQDALDNKVGNTPDEVFESLTDNGRIQGIYMDNGNFYVNGEYINAKNLKVVNSEGTPTLTIDNSGNVSIKASSLSIGADNVATSSGVQEAIKKNVKNVETLYRLSDSETSLTGSYEWSTTSPVWQNGKYIWTKTVTTYVDGSTKTDGPACISGAKGESGSDGKGISSTVVTYQASTSGTVAPTGNWLSTVPTVSAGQYLWTRTVINYTDGKSTTSYSIGKMGEQGPQGAAGSAGVSITKVDVEYAVNTSTTTAPTSGWKTTTPTWANGQYIWSRTKTTYSVGDPTYTNPACITGGKGATGTAGKGIASTTITYQASTSGTTTPTGAWTSSIPTVSAGQYLWTKTVINYTDSTSSTSYSIGKMGEQGSQGNDGKGIKSTVVTYQASTSGTTTPTGTWTSTVPTVSAGQYLWTKTVITYTDNNSTTSYSIGKMGEQGPQGATGAPGKGIVSITELYKILDTKAQQPTPTSDTGWVTTPPTWSTGKYIHTCSKIVYQNPTSTVYTTPICDNSWEAVNEIYTQEAIFNKLFANGTQGFELVGGKVYISGEIIKASAITAEILKGKTINGAIIQGGTIGIGGTSYNAFTVDSSGNLTINGGVFKVTNAGALTASNATITGGSLKIGSNFSVSTTGALIASGATINGSITAASGKIATFKIDSNNLIGTNVGMSGTSGTNMAFWAGSNTPASAPFRVSHAGAVTASNVTLTGGSLSIGSTFSVSTAGVLKASNATISGALTASSGKIAGFTISGNDLKGTNVGMGGTGSANPAFWAGNSTPTSSPFYVTQAGALTASNATITGKITASSGKIAGYTINGNQLIGTNVGMSGLSGEGVAFWAGGSTPTSAPFRVTHGGILTATGANITGTINATSGNFSGSISSSATITGGAIKGARVESSTKTNWTTSDPYTYDYSVSLSGANLISSVYKTYKGDTSNGYTYDIFDLFGSNLVMKSGYSPGNAQDNVLVMSPTVFRMQHGVSGSYAIKVNSEASVGGDPGVEMETGLKVLGTTTLESLNVNGTLKISNSRVYASNEWTSSKATTGYCKFPNGVIIQWGYSTITPTAADTITSLKVTFPIAFPSACRFVNATPRSTVPNKLTTSCGDITASSFSICMTRTNTTLTSFNWLAVGY